MMRISDSKGEVDDSNVVWPGDVHHVFVASEWLRIHEHAQIAQVLLFQLPAIAICVVVFLTGVLARVPCFFWVVALAVVLRLWNEISLIRDRAHQGRRENWIAYGGAQESLVRRASSGESIRFFWRGKRTLVPIPAHLQTQEGLFVCIDDARAKAQVVMLGDTFVRELPSTGSFQSLNWDISFVDGNVILKRISRHASTS